MRLLLDEHYSKLIAEQLRERGHDVIAVAERAELRSLNDADILAFAVRDRRAIVTENWADFDRLLRQHEHEGTAHYGVIFTSRLRLPRSRDTVGLFVEALDGHLRANPGDADLLNRYEWLST